MQSNYASLPTLDELCTYVHEKLCEHDNLDQEQTPLQQFSVTRRDKPCGLFFAVNGPRMVKLYAIWTGEEQRVLFYESNGLRFAEAKLVEGPEVEGVA